MNERIMTIQTTFLIAGALAGVAGLLVFLIVHHLWIQPIWFILPFGLPIAIAGGLAVGWSYAELSPHLPRPPWTALSIVAMITIILLPAFILAEIRAPIFSISGRQAVLAVSTGRAVVLFALELVLTSVLAGWLIGWVVGGTRQAALSTALAGLIFAIGPGHNIPLIGGTSGVGKEVAIMGTVIVVSAIVLVGSQSLISHTLGATGLGALD
jgi:hypothetical protein